MAKGWRNTASILRHDSIVGRAARLPLRAVAARYRGRAVRILSGPCRGMRWIIGEGIHGYWLGTHERRAMHRFAPYVRPGGCFVDVGAHCGYWTLWGSRRAGPTGLVVAIEPLPENVRTLNQHRALNALMLQTQTVHGAAGATDGGSVRLARPTTTDEAHIVAEGEPGILVPAVTVDAIASLGGLRPTAVKIDVEGAELDVLRGMELVCARYHPAIHLSAHGDEIRSAVPGALAQLGYASVVEYAPNDFIAT